MRGSRKAGNHDAEHRGGARKIRARTMNVDRNGLRRGVITTREWSSTANYGLKILIQKQ